MLNNLNNILIFSRPVQSGKTTALFQHIKNMNNVVGFLTPDVDGKRMFFDITKNKYHPFETNETDPLLAQQIGRFFFLQSTFETGKNIINKYNNQTFFIIDEVGKLEVEMDRGFEPAIKNLILNFKSKNYKGILLLVIRDTLIEKVIEKYDLQNVKVINHL